MLIYDGECRFCARWIARWQRITGDRVRYRPYREARADYPQVTEAAAREAVQLVLPDGGVRSGAAAVARTLREVRGWRWAHFAYERIPGVGRVAEAVYRRVAGNRSPGGGKFTGRE